MRRFVPVLSDLWPKCSPNQLQKLEDIYSPYDDFDAAGKHYLPPCTQTTSVVTSTENVELVESLLTRCSSAPNLATRHEAALQLLQELTFENEDDEDDDEDDGE